MSKTPPDFLSSEQFAALFAALERWFETARAEVFTIEVALQAGAAALCLAAGLVLGGPLIGLLRRIFSAASLAGLRQAAERLGRAIAGTSLSFFLLLIARIGFEEAGSTVFVLDLAISLTGAWVVIRIASAFIAEPFWARLIANLVWAVAALNILGLLQPFATLLDGIGLTLGTDEGGMVNRISLLTVLRTLFILAVLYWLARRVSKLLTARVQTVPNLTPSARILISNTVQITLIAVALLTALNLSGVDLAALAIFSGAVGLGIGFGLQKIFANLISGLILLMDRSIKPGDVITLEDTYGHVNKLGMRYSSVITRDGMEHLIPNEDFITTKVINWSYSDRAVRVKRAIGVAYDTDVPRAMEIIVEAANTVPRVLEAPATRCLLRGFDDSAITLEVRFWIADPEGGVNNVSSEVLVAIWTAFKAHGVQFPFPQRDVHLVGSDTLPVRIERGPRGEASPAPADTGKD